MPLQCSPNYTLCKDGSECVEQEYWCDSINDDCLDGSDESNCDVCNDHRWQCLNTSTLQCINRNWVCDGASDCEDGSDEFNCSFVVNRPVQNDFTTVQSTTIKVLDSSEIALGTWVAILGIACGILFIILVSAAVVKLYSMNKQKKNTRPIQRDTTSPSTYIESTAHGADRGFVHSVVEESVYLELENVAPSQLNINTTVPGHNSQVDTQRLPGASAAGNVYTSYEETSKNLDTEWDGYEVPLSHKQHDGKKAYKK